MSRLDNCPKCKSSFIDKEISEKSRVYFGGAKYFRRDIGIQINGIYDGAIAKRCPGCGHEFPRDNSVWAISMFDKYLLYKDGVVDDN